MKVLVLTNLYPPHSIGGYESRCQYTVEALRSRGHSVSVLTSNHQVEGATCGSETAVFRELQVHGYYGHPWLPIHALYRLEKANQKILKQTIDKIRPDVIHVWNMGGISKSLLHTLEASSTAIVYDISDHWIARSLRADVWLAWWNHPRSLISKAFNTFAKFGIRKYINQSVPTAPINQLKFKHIYFCSEFMRTETAAKGFPVEHASVIHCGVDANSFARKSQYKALKKFIWVGRLAEDKDPLTAIRGFLIAAESQPDWTLDVYGHGSPEYTSLLQSEISKTKAADRINIRSVSHAAMYALYAKYDAYLFTSNWGEPFALTPLEAMASGLPVIMCPDGGDAELLEDGSNAIGFTAGDPISLANAIKRLNSLPDFGKELSESALDLVQQKYTLETMCDQIEDTLRDVLN